MQVEPPGQREHRGDPGVQPGEGGVARSLAPTILQSAAQVEIRVMQHDGAGGGAQRDARAQHPVAQLPVLAPGQRDEAAQCLEVRARAGQVPGEQIGEAQRLPAGQVTHVVCPPVAHDLRMTPNRS